MYRMIISCQTLDSSCYLCLYHKILMCLHLNDTSGNRWIGHGGPIAWPPSSPDLTPLDIHFWGYMKTLVYETPVHEVMACFCFHVETQEDLVTIIQVVAGIIRDLPEIFPRIRHDNQAIHKMYRSWL